MSKRFLIAAPLLLLLSSLASGQTTQTATNRPPPSANIEGSIILTTNQAMEHYEILLLAKDAEQMIARTYTDLSGRYRFSNITGDYGMEVVVRIPGFDEARVPVKVYQNTTSIVNVMMNAKADAVVKPEQWEPDVVNVEELGRKYPRKAIDNLQKAADSKRKGDTAKAIELLEEALKLAPKFYDAHNLLGAIYQGLNRFRDAEMQYNLARNLSPASIAPFVNLATLYLQEAEASVAEGPFVTGVMYDDALHILQAAGKIDPHNASIFFLIGVTLYRSHSYRIAEASFKEALSIDEKMGTARLALANLYIQEQKWKDALTEFDAYLAENPKAADRSQVEAIRSKVIQQL